MYALEAETRICTRAHTRLHTHVHYRYSISLTKLIKTPAPQILTFSLTPLTMAHIYFSSCFNFSSFRAFFSYMNRKHWNQREWHYVKLVLKEYGRGNWLLHWKATFGHMWNWNNDTLERGVTFFSQVQRGITCMQNAGWHILVLVISMKHCNCQNIHGYCFITDRGWKDSIRLHGREHRNGCTSTILHNNSNTPTTYIKHLSWQTCVQLMVIAHFHNKLMLCISITHKAICIPTYFSAHLFLLLLFFLMPFIYRVEITDL